MVAYGCKQAIEYLEHWGYGKRGVASDAAMRTGLELVNELRISEPCEAFLKEANKDILCVTGSSKPI